MTCKIAVILLGEITFVIDTKRQEQHVISVMFDLEDF